MKHISEARDATSNRFQMIDQIKISNFKRFKSLFLKKCRPINVIVGENGSGKTALLEAIYLALCTQPERAVAIRGWRGFDGELIGASDSIITAIFGDLFQDPSDLEQKINVDLLGRGPECRSLSIYRTPPTIKIPTGAKSTSDSEVVGPIHFDWTAADKKRHRSSVRLTSGGITFEPTGEVLPNCYFYPATQAPSSKEAARMLSDLRKKRIDREFVKLFTTVFDWIEDLTVEEAGGAPMIHAAMIGKDRLLPLPSISGAVNRAVAILLAIASRENGLVLVDEIDNGVFHTRHEPLARLIIDVSRQYNTQVFLSTHSAEWLEAFIRAAGKRIDDICLWRLSGAEASPTATWFGGKTFKAGVESSGEIR